MALVVIQDPLKKDYQQIFRHVLATKPLKGLDIHLNCTIDSANSLNLMLMELYPQVREILVQLGYDYKFNIDVLFNEVNYTVYQSIYHLSSEPFTPKGYNGSVFPLDVNIPQVDSSQLSDDANSMSQFETVAVGGTFDHIHDGHKILLSLALYLTNKVLIIGITDDELLQKKQYKEYLQSFELRLRITNEFVQKCGRQSQEYDIYKINDVYGPTGYLKPIDCLVLSKESAKGGEMVNQRRQELDLPQLKVFTIDLVGGDDKLSSTDLRKLEMEEHEQSNKKRRTQ